MGHAPIGHGKTDRNSTGRDLTDLALKEVMPDGQAAQGVLVGGQPIQFVRRVATVV